MLPLPTDRTVLKTGKVLIKSGINTAAFALVISANLIGIARGLIVPEGRMRVAWHEVPGMA
jgi:hypothetical protein